ncbi:MAG: tetratricopeptide repeat protein [Planctomycetota bacterium]
MSDDVNNAYMEGLKAFGAGEHTTAVEHYDRALGLDPDNVAVLNAKAMSLVQLERFDEAVATVQRAIELDPEDPMLDTSLSIIYQRAGKIDEAEAAAAQHRLKSWKQELKQNPSAPPPQEDTGFNVIQ